MNKNYQLEAKLISLKMNRSDGNSIYDDDMILQISGVKIKGLELYLILDVLDDNWSLYTTERIVIKNDNKIIEIFLRNIKKIDIYYNSIRINIKCNIKKKIIVVNAMSIMSIYESLYCIYNFHSKLDILNFSTFPGVFRGHK